LLRIADAPAWRPLAFTSAALIALTAIHPQMIPVLGLIWIVYQGLLIAWGARPSIQSVAAQAAPFLATTPLLAYNSWILFRDPTIAEWARQWRHQAPGPVSLAVSLGLPLLAAILGMVIAWRRRDRGLALLLVWPPLVIALLYLPNLANIQRRLLDALYVPIGILAALGIRTLTSRLRRARAHRIEAILVTVCCLSSAIVLAIALRFASGAFAEAYIGSDSWQAMQWLSAHHQPSDRVLSSPGAGQLLPAWAGTHVYVGHYSETLDYFQKIRNVGEVLKPGEPEATVRAFLHDNGITLLYWGVDEAATGFRPGDQSYLQLVHQDRTVAIYRVQLGQ
jgi:asparagine N-glycosylation enzyme membrane subunit Stt3